MDTLVIKVSPKVAEILGKSKQIVLLLSAFIDKLLSILEDGKMSWDELLILIGQIVNIGRHIAKR